MKLLFLKIIFFFLSIVFSCDAKAQWWKSKTFHDRLSCVYINENIAAKNIGFLSVGNPIPSAKPPIQLWKTTDAGVNWYLVIEDKSSYISDILFKDSLNGWATSGFSNVTPKTGVLKTTDAGETWILQKPIDGGFRCSDFGPGALHYNSTLKYLYASAPGIVGACAISLSTDEGSTWAPISNSPAGSTGFAFINDSVGINGMTGYWPNEQPVFKTTDGGKSWFPLSLTGKSDWQPLGIKNTSMFFIASWYTGDIYRSLDEGVTWDTIQDYGVNIDLTGTIRGNASRLYIQRGAFASKNGIMISEDSGKTFNSICGPSNEFLVRFYVTDNNICYAFDNLSRIRSGYDSSSLWINTTGKGSGKRIVLGTNVATNELSLTTGSTGEVTISLPDTLPTISVLLDSLTIALSYNTNLLTCKKIIPTLDWSLVSSKEMDGKIYIQLRRIGITDPNGKEVAKVTFQANLSDTTETSIIVDTVFYNQGEILNCSPVIEEQVHVTVEDVCGDSIIRAFLLTQKPISIVSIYPNPTVENVTLDFNSALESKLTLEVLDDLGRVVQEEELQAIQGSNTHVVFLPKHLSGLFYLRLQMGKDVVTGKFVKQ